MNEASAAAAIVILSKLVTGVTPVISQTFKTKLKAIINLIAFYLSIISIIIIA
jgi:hypothetical protein